MKLSRSQKPKRLLNSPYAQVAEQPIRMNKPRVSCYASDTDLTSFSHRVAVLQFPLLCLETN